VARAPRYTFVVNLSRVIVGRALATISDHADIRDRWSGTL
jgi:hypothetical protein